MKEQKTGPKKLTRLLDNVLVRLLIWRKILILTDGRDKTLKVFQYSAKVLLWTSVLAAKSKSEAKAKLLASHFSLIRKVLRLGHVLEPFHDGLDLVKKESFETLADKLAPLNAVIGIANDLSDDVICLSKLGMLDKPWLDFCTPLSDRLWYAGIFIDVHANITDYKQLSANHEKEVDKAAKEKLASKMFISRISLVKLISDFVFCTIDVFHLDVNGGVQAVSGLTAALLGTYKLYIKHK